VASSQDAGHKKVLAKAKGYYNARRKVYRHGQAGGHQGRPVRLPRPPRQEARHARAVDHAHQRGRPRFDLSYSRMMAGLKAAGLEIDRKTLADLAVHDIEAFGKIAEQARAALAA